ncbi:MAG: DUF11 domain-containing protein [Clostridium sp.]|uniref:hypothetical protein n=1 Tax=Clostridium sp. TaxID=1506 RepID=UPI0025C54817|nr:hypothetical protein [Clostridium sp.]MCF0148281.1 DUF11 domain-containing protein [Clostridium sp.]
MNKKLRNILTIIILITYIFSVKVFTKDSNVLALTSNNVVSIDLIDEVNEDKEEIENNEINNSEIDNSEIDNSEIENNKTDNSEIENNKTDKTENLNDDTSVSDDDANNTSNNSEDVEEKEVDNNKNSNNEIVEKEENKEDNKQEEIYDIKPVAEDIVRISTEEELRAIKSTGNYELANDIKLTSKWNPIETFSGVFNGNGHTISNMTINEKNDGRNVTHSNLGFIYKLYGTVENVIFENVVIDSTEVSNGKITKSGSDLGVVSAYNYGTISEVTVIGLYMVGDSYMGGIAGQNYGTISKALVSMQSCGENRGIYSYQKGEVKLDELDLNGNKTDNVGGQFIGGIVGYIPDNGKAKVISSVANVNIIFGEFLGGIVGYARGGDIISSYATGYLCGFHDVGGIAGRGEGSSQFYNIYSSVQLDGYGMYRHVAAIGHSVPKEMHNLYQDIQMGTGGTNYLEVIGQNGLQLLLGTDDSFFGQVGRLEGLLTKDMIYNNWNPGGSEAWTTMDGYYPQLEYFATHENPIIRKASANSVQAVELATPDEFSLLGKGDVSSNTITHDLWNQIDTWKYVRSPFNMSPNNISGYVNDWRVLEQGNDIEEELININKNYPYQYFGYFISKEAAREAIGVSTTGGDSDNICKKVILYGTGSTLEVEKTVNTNIAEYGTELEYTITVKNTGLLPLMNVDVVDMMAVDYSKNNLQALYDNVSSVDIIEFKDSYHRILFKGALNNTKKVLDSQDYTEEEIKAAYIYLLEASIHQDLDLASIKDGMIYKSLGHINTLNANGSATYSYKIAVPKNAKQNSEYYNVATANSGKLITSDSESAKVPEKKIGELTIEKKVQGIQNEDKFTVHIKGEEFETYLQVKNGESVTLEVPLGEYTVTEIISKDYQLLEVKSTKKDNSSNSMTNGSKVVLDNENDALKVNFLNKYIIKSYFHNSNSKANIFSGNNTL